MPKFAPKTRPARFAYYVLPLILWMTLIFSASTDTMSAAHTRPVVQSLLLRLLPFAKHYLTPAQIDRVDYNLRKTAHVTEYAILSILAYRALAFGNPRFRSRHVAGAIVFGILYAASDEYHQSFTPSRWAAAADVTFDTFGVMIGQVLCLWKHALDRER